MAIKKHNCIYVSTKHSIFKKKKKKKTTININYIFMNRQVQLQQNKNI